MSASPPKLFISYSWTSPAHEARVLQLATDLRESRVESGRTLLDLIGLNLDLKEILGCDVDVLTEDGVSPYLRERILREAVPL